MNISPCNVSRPKKRRLTELTDLHTHKNCSGSAILQSSICRWCIN